MELILAIVQDQEANDLMSILTEKRFKVTKLASTGGFLKSGNTTLKVTIQSIANLLKRTLKNINEYFKLNGFCLNFYN